MVPSSSTASGASLRSSLRIRLFLVDDNEIDRVTIHRLLREAENVVVAGEADDLALAIDGLKSTPSDIVLLDLNLPDSRGVGTVQHLRDAYPEQPIIVFTGFNDEEQGREAIAAGAQDFLSKDGLGSQNLLRSIFFTIERVRRRDYEQHNKELRRELELTTSMQRRLTSSPTLEIPGLEIAGINQAIALAGGDYYDLGYFRDGALGFILADISGHNFDASMVMFALRRAFRTAVRLVTSFRELMEILEETVSEENQEDQFATCFLGRISPKDKTLTYMGAGHDGWLFDAEGHATPLDATSPPLGTKMGVRMEEAGPIPFPAGSTLAAVTDGFHEAPSTSAWQFSRDRVLSSLRSNLHLPAQRILDTLAEEVHRFCGSRLPRDDMSGVVVKSLHHEAESGS